MASNSQPRGSISDASESYFFERLSVEHSMMRSLLSGMRIAEGNFGQVGNAYESIIIMEQRCRDQLESITSSSNDIVGKMAAVDLCEDLLRSSDREVAVVKMMMTRTKCLMDEAQSSLVQYDSSHSTFDDIREKVGKSARIQEILADMHTTANKLREELSAARENYGDLMTKWAQRMQVRNQLFNDIGIARRVIDEDEELAYTV